jgi:hypothetical protein
MLLTNATWWLIGVAVDQQEVTDTGSALSLAELLDRPARAAP